MRHILPSFVVGRGALPPNVVGTLLPDCEDSRPQGPFIPSSSSNLTSEGTPRILESIGATVAVDKSRRRCRASVFDGPGFVQRRKTVKPNVAPDYSSGPVF